MKPKLTEEQYVKEGGGKCPFCLSDNISGEGVEIDGREASQGVTCMSCGATWTDFYTLARIVIMDEPDEEEAGDYPIVDWQYEVANGNTKLGYEEWKAHMIESEG